MASLSCIAAAPLQPSVVNSIFGESSVETLQANDLNELKKLQKPSDIIKLIFDCVGLLKMEKVQPVQQDEVIIGIGKEKQTLPFLKVILKRKCFGTLRVQGYSTTVL